MEEYPETGELPEFHLLARRLNPDRRRKHSGNDLEVLNFYTPSILADQERSRNIE
jgi:hypothetical protein